MSLINRFLRSKSKSTPAREQELLFFYPKDVSWNVADVHQMEANGQFQEALRCWEKMLAIFREPELPAEYLKLPAHRYIKLHIGQCYRNLEQYDDALKAFGQARNLARESNDEPMLCEVAIGVGVVYRLRGEFAKALREYEHALAEAKRIKLWELVASILNSMSVCYEAMGDLNRALAEAKKAHEIIEERPAQVTDTVQARVLLSLGLLYLELGQTKEAGKLLQKALERARRAGSRTLEADVLAVLSRII